MGGGDFPFYDKARVSVFAIFLSCIHALNPGSILLPVLPHPAQDCIVQARSHVSCVGPDEAARFFLFENVMHQSSLNEK